MGLLNLRFSTLLPLQLLLHQCEKYFVKFPVQPPHHCPVGHSDNTQQFFDLKPRIEKLVEAQNNNDVVTAQEILQQAFRTDVRAVVAEARLRSGSAINPLQLFRQMKIREQLIKERGAKTVATGL